MNLSPFSNGRTSAEAITLRQAVLVIITAGLVTIAFFGWRDALYKYFEISRPQILITEIPRGIGVAAATLKVVIRDEGAGLSEILISQSQGVKKTTLTSQTDINGARTKEFTLDFYGAASGLQPGRVSIDIFSRDNTLWHNTATRTVEFLVDYEKPLLNLVSMSSSTTAGGSSLVIYKASDENLGETGVTVGGHTYRGYPARLLDPSFADPFLFFSLFAIPLESQSSATQLKLYADDKVGNAASMTREVVAQPSTQESVVVPLLEDWIHSTRKDPKKLKENVIPLLEPDDIGKLSKYLSNSQFERFWNQPLIRFDGKIVVPYGGLVTYKSPTWAMDPWRSYFESVSTPEVSDEVSVGAPGTVRYAGATPDLGGVLLIDHGLGLYSLYAHLGIQKATEGKRVKEGEVIGQSGRSGLAFHKGFSLMMLVGDQPVSPKEWRDPAWFGRAIVSPIIEAKRSLGLPVPFSLNR